MAFDGLYLQKIKQELDGCIGAKLDRIAQPSREALVLTLHNRRLLIMAGGACPKLHFTTAALENPAAAPMFCMLLRKHLGGGRLAAVEQQGLDRLLCLSFDCWNELGESVRLSLWCEIMGRRSNVVLVGPDGKIIDALRRVDFVDSETRQLLPNLPYTLPAAQDKADLRALSPEQAAQKVTAGRASPLSRALVECFTGFSPVPAREVAFRVCGAADLPADSLSEAQNARLVSELAAVQAALAPGGGKACGVFGDGETGEAGEPLEYNCFPLTCYPASCETRVYDGFSALLDDFYREKDAAEGIRKRKTELLRTLTSILERLRRKLANRREEQRKSEGRETLRQYADILSANLNNIAKGARALTTENFYGAPGETVTIPLEAKLSPAANAQKYYNDYRKATAAHRMLDSLIAEAEGELAYIESVIEAAQRAASSPELDALARELSDQGYLKRARQTGKKPQKAPTLPFLEYRSSDGFTILCGRNNLQNDLLTHKTAQAGDLWLHLQKAPGSHVIIVAEGREIPDSTITEAAVIAAVNSSARGDGRAAVDYLPARKVKKPNGARPGFAVYNGYQTAYVVPDAAKADSLKTGRTK